MKDSNQTSGLDKACLANKWHIIASSFKIKSSTYWKSKNQMVKLTHWFCHSNIESSIAGPGSSWTTQWLKVLASLWCWTARSWEGSRPRNWTNPWRLYSGFCLVGVLTVLLSWQPRCALRSVWATLWKNEARISREIWNQSSILTLTPYVISVLRVPVRQPWFWSQPHLEGQHVWCHSYLPQVRRFEDKMDHERVEQLCHIYSYGRKASKQEGVIGFSSVAGFWPSNRGGQLLPRLPALVGQARSGSKQVLISIRYWLMIQSFPKHR